MSWSYRAPVGRSKHDKERARLEKKQSKAERLAYRRAARLHGVEIETLPEDIRGLARTLTNGDTDGR